MENRQDPQAQYSVENTQNALNGGLKGRFRNSLNTVGNAFEALADYLKHNTTPVEYQKVVPLLDEMDNQFALLYRLADYTADAALGHVLHQVYQPAPMDLLQPIKMACELFGEEMAQVDGKATLQLSYGDLELLPAIGERHMVCALLANLLSNAIQARADCTVRLHCARGQITCWDNGPGLSPDMCALLERGELTAELLDEGGMGLLLVHQYAAAMGWQITTELPADGGTSICFALPPLPTEHTGGQQVSLQSDVTTAYRDRMYCRNLLHREILAARHRTAERTNRAK